MEFKSSNYSEAFKKFADWVESLEKRLSSACHCCPQPNTKRQTNNPEIITINYPLSINGIATETITEQEETGAITTTTTLEPIHQQQTISNSSNNNNNRQNRILNWNNVISYHQNLQNEVEDFGKPLDCELKRHLNEDSTQEQWDESSNLEKRWFKLWLKSLEQLVVVEKTRRCPMHNSTMIGKSPTSPANKSVARPQRRRPISYPNNYSERLEWDYRNTLSLTGCHKENGSQIDLDSVDEQITKNLTEFGENYELWFGKEDEIACIAMHSRPPSVEPAEKPEIAKAVVTSDPDQYENGNCSLLMLTTPSSMFSVDASKCSHKQKQSYKWRLIGSFLFALILLIFSTLYHEPHHMHKSYYHTQPPV